MFVQLRGMFGTQAFGHQYVPSLLLYSARPKRYKKLS